MVSYRIEIDGAGFGSSTVPSDGFIDHTKVEQYLTTGSGPNDYALSLRKERANFRYRDLVSRIQEFANIYITDIDAPAATVNTVPTSFNFTATVERAGALLTEDEDNPGTMLNGVAALRRAVARAMVMSKTRIGEVYDPTLSFRHRETSGPQAARTGRRIESVEYGSLFNNLTAAESRITITEI